MSKFKIQDVKWPLTVAELMFKRQNWEDVEIDTIDADGVLGQFWDNSSLSEGLESVLITYPKKKILNN